MNLLKQSTAATIKLGPFVDSTDGVTPETALTISQADIRLSKNGGAFAQSNNVAGATHDENGWYGIPLDTTDTGTLGRLQVAVYESGALPCFAEFLVVPANTYDSLIAGTDVLTADVTQISGDATSLADLKDFADAGYDPITNKVQGVVLTDTVTTLTNKADFALSAAAIDAIIDDVIEGTVTMRQALRIFLAALAGKSTGGGTATLTFRDNGDTKARITATVDANGNRTAMTLDGT